MAAGDLITADWQVEIRTTLFGSGNYPIKTLDVSGPAIIQQDVPKLLSDGDFQGFATYGPLFVTVVFDVIGTTAANLETRIATAKTAWAKATSDIEFVWRLGGTKYKVSGRPIEFDRPVITPDVKVHNRAINARAQFKAGNPTVTTI